MNKVEQMHLDAIKDSYHTYRLDEEDDSIVDTLFLENKAASKSAEITEKIVVDFFGWCLKKYRYGYQAKKWSLEWKWVLDYENAPEGSLFTTQQLFKEFLKTKQ